MTEMLELALAKVSKLPKEAQDRIGLEILEEVAALEQLRADIQIGIDEIDAGLGRPLDIEQFLAELHQRHAD